MFVDAIPGAVLAHDIRNALSKAILRIKIVERPGATWRYQICNTYPFDKSSYTE